MTWSITEVARMSGVTSRTLRHYDAVGLLPPARVGANGYRYYERAQLLRLQQILLLRELGLGLEVIADVLDGDQDPLTALRGRRQEVLAQRDRLDRVVQTIDRTIEKLEGGEDMGAADLFAGFDHRRHEAEARERWGDEAVEASHRRYEAMSRQELAGAQADHEAACTGLAELLGAGVPAHDERALDLVARHHAFVSRFRDVDAEGYRCLGRLYVEDPRFTRTYEVHRTGLARYVSEAIAAYADQRM